MMISRHERIVRLRGDVQELERELWKTNTLRDDQHKRLRLLKEELAELCGDDRYYDDCMRNIPRTEH